MISFSFGKKELRTAKKQCYCLGFSMIAENLETAEAKSEG
jgi:hypothetical protein